VADVVKLYDDVRAMYGPTKKICTTGESAGAHLALMVAVQRPTVSCVVAHAGPTDLVKTDGNTFYAKIVSDGMGADPAWLTANSPTIQASKIRSKVFVGHHVGDLFVPVQQARRLTAALGTKATLRELKSASDCPKGAESPCLYVHAGARKSDIDALYVAALSFAAAAPASPPAS
jgi:dipeptidyl aminopeptidase/acylaminoacyl peptidase